jgi:hypothetical protein
LPAAECWLGYRSRPQGLLAAPGQPSASHFGGGLFIAPRESTGAAMPRDDWGRLAARDLGRRAIRSGNYDRLETDREARRNAEVVNCPKCRSLDVKRRERRFKDGSEHVEVRCAKCGRHIKWEGR